ncbi:unnamed protein product [Spirodela intermedia]|uniref:Uncharacterized protein n=1 Tax=Spirodela intermedia TaxID=51605 RepID=A0A7I8ILG0_SPIIN|nr:unnamed protein product [Spirodela intermedia]CAA6658784.1 unnamed protein product [Spirodela intermedia]
MKNRQRERERERERNLSHKRLPWWVFSVVSVVVLGCFQCAECHDAR